MLRFEFADEHRRAAGVVGDTLADVFGHPDGGLPTLLLTCQEQPEGSDLFADGLDLTWREAKASSFSHPGIYRFTVATDTDNDEVEVNVVAVIWPAAALETDELRYLDRPLYAANGQHVGPRVLTNSPRIRQPGERRLILRNIARACDLVATKSLLENPQSPPTFVGLNTDGLGLGLRSLSAFGASW